MTIEACYRQLDGDLAQAEKHLSGRRLVERFMVRFLDDDSFASLCSAMEEGSRGAAFRADAAICWCG